LQLFSILAALHSTDRQSHSSFLAPRSELFGSLALSLRMRFVFGLLGTMFALDVLWWGDLGANR
jgi:hypothetical protein